MDLNASVPRFECLVRKEFLYNCETHHGEYESGTVFGVASLQGRALGFHVLLDNGSVIWRLPIHALCWAECQRQDLADLELWDCFSYQIGVTEFDHLAEMQVLAYLPDEAFPGSYMFTVDWYGSAYAEDAGPGGHKCAHIIKLDNGNFCAQPNNRLAWHEPSVATLPKDGPAPKPDYKIMCHTWKVENGRAWRTTDDDRYFYGVERVQSIPEPAMEGDPD